MTTVCRDTCSRGTPARRKARSVQGLRERRHCWEIPTRSVPRRHAHLGTRECSQCWSGLIWSNPSGVTAAADAICPRSLWNCFSGATFLPLKELRQFSTAWARSSVRRAVILTESNSTPRKEIASWKRRDRPWFALLEFALSVEVPRGIADERDSADRTVTPTGNKTKMNGFVEISTLLIHSAPKQKSNEWMHLSPFYTRMHGEWLRYAKSTSQFHWRFLLVRYVRGFQVNPLCRHDITRSDRQIGNPACVLSNIYPALYCQITNFSECIKIHYINKLYLSKS